MEIRTSLIIKFMFFYKMKIQMKREQSKELSFYNIKYPFFNLYELMQKYLIGILKLINGNNVPQGKLEISKR